MSRRRAFLQLVLARYREYWREPEVIFWMFGFPLLLTVALGIAFRSKPAEDKSVVAVLNAPGAQATLDLLQADQHLAASLIEPSEADNALRMGRVAVVVVPGEKPELRFDPSRPDAGVAWRAVDDAMQRGAGRSDKLEVKRSEFKEPGGRYIDFLVPGLMGMNIMGGGMWGVGFVLVEMRMRKLMKRLIATPMHRADFLAAMITSRMSMVFVELALILVFGILSFGVPLRGNLLAVLSIILIGSFCFCGMGLLTASRADKIETATGIMNLVMMPMWVFGGIFFSSARFPAIVQPLIKALPLTALNDALRAVILEGAPLSAQLTRIAIMLAWGGISFLVAVRIFRWN